MRTLRIGLGLLCALSAEHTQTCASWGAAPALGPMASPSGMQTGQVPQDSGLEPLPVPSSSPFCLSWLLGLQLESCGPCGHHFCTPLFLDVGLFVWKVTSSVPFLVSVLVGDTHSGNSNSEPETWDGGWLAGKQGGV